MSEAPDGSITRRNSPRDDLLAFEVRARITKPDIEWMADIADAAMSAHGEIDMLIIMTNFQGADAGAVFDGPAMGVEARSVAHIRRYAVVGGPQFVRAMITVSGYVMPVETKTLELSQEPDAWAWLAEPRRQIADA